MDYPPPLPDPGADTIRRYVIATSSTGRARYLELLGGRFVRLPSSEHTGFRRDLRDDAQRISDDELTFLLQPGRRPNWRPRLVAAHLVGIDRRTQFRDVLGELLLASEVCYSGKGYCFALAAFGTDSDARILTAYLDRYLPQPDLRYDQDWAMGALLHLDAQIDTSHARQYLTRGGLWDRYSRSSVADPPVYRFCQEYIEHLTAL